MYYKFTHLPTKPPWVPRSTPENVTGLNDTCWSYKSYCLDSENDKFRKNTYDFRLTSLKTVWKQPTSFPLPDVGQCPCLCRHPLDNIIVWKKLVRNIQDSASGLYRTEADPNLFARPRPTMDSMRSSVYLGRDESRTQYFRDGKLIIGAAKLIDLDYNIKIFRG